MHAPAQSPLPPLHPEPPHQPLKHWRSFGPDEWRHVSQGALAGVLGGLLPAALFYVTLKAVSFPVAVVVVLGWSALVFAGHRRHSGQADVFSAATFGFAILEALIGLASLNPILYLATPSLKNVIYGLVFVGSALLGRPLLALYARRLYPIPWHVQRSPVYQRVFLVASCVWLVGLTGRAALRLWLLRSLPLEWFLVADAIATWPFSVLMVGFTIWYPLRSLRRAGLLADTAPPAPVDADTEAAVV